MVYVDNKWMSEPEMQAYIQQLKQENESLQAEVNELKDKVHQLENEKSWALNPEPLH